VCTPSGIIKFKATLEGLYCWEPTKAYQKEITQMKKVRVSNHFAGIRQVKRLYIKHLVLEKYSYRKIDSKSLEKQ
jgi:hypothetical protein